MAATPNLAELALRYTHEQTVDAHSGQPRYCDVPAFLKAKFDTSQKIADHGAALRKLEADVLRIMGASLAMRGKPYTKNVPADPSSDGEMHFLRIWQIAYVEELSMKGASPAHAIKTCMQVFMSKGCRTEKIPIEVLYKLSSQASIGNPVPDFQVGISNGFAVTSACHLLCLAAIEKDWVGQGLLSSSSAELLLRCIRLQGMYEPQADMKEQAYTTLSSKNLAALRMRPSVLQMLTLPKPQWLFNCLTLIHLNAEVWPPCRPSEDEWFAENFKSLAHRIDCGFQQD